MTVKVDKVPFEEALNMTGLGKFNVALFMLSGSIIMGMTFEIFSVAYLVPGSACELKTTSVQQGLIAAVPLAGIIAMSHMSGYMADTKGRKKTLFVSLVMGFITGALAALSPHWIVLCVLKFLSSCSVAGAFPLAITLLSECTPMVRRNTLVILLSTVFLSTTGIMAVLTIPVLPLSFSYYIPFLNIHFNSWRLLDLIFCIPCILSAIGVSFAYESPKYLLSIGEEKEALKVLKGIYAINNGKNEDDYKVLSLTLDEDNATRSSKGFFSSVLTQTLPLMKPPLLKDTLLISIMFIIVYISFNPFMVWLPYIADGFIRSVQRGEENLTFCDMMRASQNSTSTELTDSCTLNNVSLVMVFGISILLASLNIVLSLISNCVGIKRLFIFLQFMAGTAGLCANFSSNWVMTAILIIAFISGVLNFGFLSTFSVDLFPTYVKAMAVCLTLMVGRGSAVLGINVMKGFLDNNCEMAFYVFGGFAVFGGIVGFVLPGDKRKKSTDKSIET